MEKKIWIMNHYATNMFFNQGGRHYWFAENLLKQGYEPIIFCANTKHNNKVIIDTERRKYVIKETNGIPFVFVKTSPYQGNGFGRVKNMFGFSKNLLLIAKKFAKDYGKPDVILASSVHPLTLVVGIIIAKKFKIPCICEIRDLWPETLVAYGAIKKESVFARILYKGEKWIYKKADSIIMTWEGGREYIVDQGWEKTIDLNKVNHISNGVVIDSFDRNSEENQVIDSDLDNEDYKNIVYAGSIRKVNNVGLLLDAAKIIQNQGSNQIRFLIYGSGDESEMLKQRCENEGIRNVIFKGRVEKKYIPYILKKGNLNIITGKDSYLYKYGFSQNKFFDYLASGKPIISNRNCHKILDELKCGIIVKGESAEALAEGILKFYNMPKEEYSIYCKNALKAARDFDFKILTDKLEKVLLED